MLDDKDRIFTNLYGFEDWGLDGAQEARRLGRHQGHSSTGPRLDRRARSRTRACAAAAAPASRPASNGRSCPRTTSATAGPHYLVVNADEMRARHLQGPRHHAPRPAQAGRGLPDRRLRDGRQRRLHLYPRRVLPRGRAARCGDRRGLRRRPVRQERLRLGLGFRRLRPPRRRRLYLRRGDRAAREPRGQEGPAAPEAAVPGQRRPLRLPDHGDQRRDDRGVADHPAPRRRLVRRHRPRRAQHRHQAVLHLRPRRASRAMSRRRWASRCAS